MTFDNKDALRRFRKGVVIPAVPLALDAARQWDKRRQRAIIRYYLEAGAGGLAVAVHTTQFEIREAGLFEPLLELVMDELMAFYRRGGEALMCIAGVCGPTPQAFEEAQIAKRLGYHAVMLSPGGLAGYSEAELLERTCRLAELMPVVAFYLQEAVGGRRFSYGYWQEVCALPGIIGIKCAPFDRYLSLDLVRAAALSPRSSEISLYTGNDDNIILDLLTTYRFQHEGETYEKGFVGGLLGHWAVWVQSAVRQLELIQKARSEGIITAELLTLAQQVTDCNAAFFDTANSFKGCIAGIHEVLRRQGLLEGIWCLNPKESLSPGQSEEIDRVYSMYPELNDDEFVKRNIAKWLI